MHIWIEKYRPRKFEDIVGNNNVIQKIRNQVESNNMTHMLLIGPAGTGKTTTAKVIAHKLLGEHYVSNFLELNASDERGIDIMREKVKSFAKASPIGVKFRILLLDEADHLTKDAQASLRRIMEKNSNNCCFILCANYGEKIIDPIKSRCSEFKFEKIDSNSIKIRIHEIAEKEEKTMDGDAIDILIKKSKGDMRKVINIFQTVSAGKNTINKEDIKDIEINENYKKVIEAIKKGKLISACNAIERNDIPLLHKHVMNMKNVENKNKAEFSILCAKYETMLNAGVAESIVLSAFISETLLEDIL